LCWRARDDPQARPFPGKSPVTADAVDVRKPASPNWRGVIRHVPHLVVVAVIDVDQNGRVTGSFQNTHLGDRFKVPK